MMRFLILGLLVAAAYGASLPKPKFAKEISERIVDGQLVDISLVPHQAALLFSRDLGDYHQTCGGSIISVNVILTAAHCSAGTTVGMWRVRVGSTSALTGGQVKVVIKSVVHQRFNSDTFDYDIGLFFLATDIALGTNAAIIALPALGANVPEDQEGQISGWGATAEGGPNVESLRMAFVPIVEQETCKNAYIGLKTITDRMMCAGEIIVRNSGACDGDAGGPLVINSEIFGITSWGVECGHSSLPGVWTRVPYFVDWIELNM